MSAQANFTLLALALTLAVEGASAEQPEGPRAPAPRVVTLAEAQQVAASHNPGARNLEELVFQADMEIRRAWSALLPQLGARGSVTRNQREVTLEFPDFSAFDPTNPAAPLPTTETVIQEKWGQAFGLTASMVLFDPSSIPIIKNAHDSAELARLTAKRRKNDLLFAVTAAYYQVHSMQELIIVARQNLELARALKDVSVERQRAGLGNRIDVLRAELQSTRARKELDNALDAQRDAKAALARLLGLEGEFEIAGPAEVAEVDGDLGTLTHRALNDRIDVREATLAEAIADRGEAEAWTRWLPVFDVTYDWSWSSAEGFTGEHAQWMLMFGARWSLFEGGGRIAALRVRQSRTRMARNDLAQVELDIRAEVEHAYLEVGKQRRNIELSEEQTALAEENLTLVDEQYRAGTASSLDALDAATELHNQRVTRVLERLRFDVSLLTLGRAVGEYHSLATVE